VLDGAAALRGVHELDAAEVEQRAHVIAHVREALLDHLGDLVRARHALVEDPEYPRPHRMRQGLGYPRIDQVERGARSHESRP
jgi:hypothetical protein